MTSFLQCCVAGLLFASLTACVQTVEPDAEDELLIKARENVSEMPQE